MLADIMAFTPIPGIGPFEGYDADETLAGGEHLELAGYPGEVPIAGPDPATRTIESRLAAATD
jgi:hypothetical protein